MTKQEILAEWRKACSRKMPAVSTAGGEIYFQLTDGLVWEWGGCSNTGLIVDGRAPYDDSVSLDENIGNIVDRIQNEYD